MLFKRRSGHPTDEELSAYMDGEMGTAALNSIAAHLQSCDDCDERLAGLETAKWLLTDLPRLEPSRSFTLGYEYAAELKPAPQRRSPLVFAPVAALTVFLALIAVDLSGSISVSQDETGGADMLAISKAEDAAAPAASESAGQRSTANNTVPSPAMVPAPATGGGGEVQPSDSPQVMPFGAPSRDDAPNLPPATGSPQAAGAAPGAAQSAEGAVTSTASQQQAADLDASNGGTDWLKVAQGVAFIAFVGSLLAVGWPLLRSRGEHN